MIFQVNEAYLPGIFNNDFTSIDLTAEDIGNIENFPIDLSSFSIFELDNGEWLTDFTLCDVCNELCQCVILYNDIDDIEAIKQRYLLDC